MKKFFNYVLRIALVIFVGVLAISPLFTNIAELEELGLTPRGYLPAVLYSGFVPTLTPTATNTPTGPTPTHTSPPPANVRFTFIEYNPPGDDVQGEYVEITNLGGTAQDIEGWAVVPTTFLQGNGDEQVLHDPFFFPSHILEPGEIVRVWTKIGIVNPPNYYWNAVTEIWLNNGDIARLFDETWQQRDVCNYDGGGQNTICD